MVVVSGFENLATKALKALVLTAAACSVFEGVGPLVLLSESLACCVVQNTPSGPFRAGSVFEGDGLLRGIGVAVFEGDGLLRGIGVAVFAGLEVPVKSVGRIKLLELE